MKNVVDFLINKLRFAHLGASQKNALPSLLQGISQVASKRMLREVMASSYDRRQWGVLAAAWMGVSERELIKQIATNLKIDYQERVVPADLSVFGVDARRVYEELHRVGAMAVLEGSQIRGFAAVDPAELQGLSLYDGSQHVALAPWSELGRALDVSEQRIAEADADVHKQREQEQEALCIRVFEILLAEAQAHGAAALDILSSEEKSYYQFMAASGHQGMGAIHSGAASDLMSYLCSRPGNLLHSSRVGPVVIRMLGGPSHLRLAWGLSKAKADRSAPIMMGASPQQARSSMGSGHASAASVVDTLSGPIVSGEAQKLVVERRHIESQPQLQRDQTQGHRDFIHKTPILVVDDNLMFGRVLEKLLKREGFEPSFAVNGSEAYERLLQTKNFIPAVIVCDLHMPIMNGKEFLVKMKSDERLRHIPVVILTSDDDIEAEVGLLEGGAEAFVSKSKDPRILCAQIRKLARKVALKEAA